MECLTLIPEQQDTLGITIARRHLSLLTRCSSSLPATETVRLRLGLLTTAWQVVGAAIASLDEIRFDARPRCTICGQNMLVVSCTVQWGEFVHLEGHDPAFP